MNRICKIAALCALLMLLTAAALAEGVLTLPSDLKTIGAEAFAGLRKVDRIVIPEGVTSIGARAFADSSVKEIHVPSTVVRISDDALDGCLNARFVSDDALWFGVYKYTVSGNVVSIKRYMGTASEITIPAAIDNKPVTTIGQMAFIDNDTLTKVVVPEGVTAIREHAFTGCVNLTDITFPSTLQYFDQKVFINCGMNATEPFYFVLPDNMVDLSGNGGGAHTFESCNAILQTGKFSQTAALLTDRNYNYTAKGEHDYRYRYNYDRDADARRLYLVRFVGTGISAAIPNGVEVVDYGAFNGCSTLRQLTIPEGVYYIRDGAFRDCVNLTHIAFPSTLQYFDQNVFVNCGKNATEPFYFVLPNNMVSLAGNGGGAHTFGDCNAILQTGKFSQTAALLTDKNYSYTVKDELDYRYRYNYDRDADVRRLYLVRFVGTGTEAAIPNGVEVVDVNAFNGCEALNKVTIPEGVYYIRDGAFRDCVNLTDIAFPSTLQYFDQNVFVNCGKNATEPFYFVLPDNMVDLTGNGGGAHTFGDCNAILQTGKFSQTAQLLTDKNYSYTVKDERDYRYRYNYDRDADVRRLYLVRFVGTGTAANIPNGVEVVDVDAFNGCSTLKQVTVPEGVYYIRDGAFRDCVNLTDITFPSTLQYFDQNVFVNCGRNATEPFYFILPNNMLSLAAHAGGAHTFGDCNAILQTGKYSQTAKLLTDKNYTYTVAGERDYRYRYIEERDGDETVRRLYLAGYVGTGTEAIIPEGIYGIYRFKWDPPYGAYDPGFFGSQTLEKVVIPDGTVFIGDSVFKDCVMLSDITLPSTIRVIENHAFENTGHQAGRRFIVALPAGIEQFTANNDAGWACFNQSAATLVAPAGSYVAHELYDNWWVYYHTVEDAENQHNLCYKPNDDPDFKYLGNP